MWIPTRQKFNYKNAAFLLLQKRKSSDTSILFLKETHAQRYSDSSTTFVIAYLSSCEVTGLININLMRTILSQSCTLMDALSSSDLSAPLHRNKKGCNYRNCLSPQMSVFIANWCHEFPSQPIRHHRLLVAWSEGANVNKNNQYIAVLRMDFCFDSSSKWEKEFSFNQWGHWGSECWKSNWRWMKSHWQAWKPNSCYLTSHLIIHFSELEGITPFDMQCVTCSRLKCMMYFISATNSGCQTYGANEVH